jgi:hypothetical protein
MGRSTEQRPTHSGGENPRHYWRHVQALLTPADLCRATDFASNALCDYQSAETGCSAAQDQFDSFILGGLHLGWAVQLRTIVFLSILLRGLFIRCYRRQDRSILTPGTGGVGALTVLAKVNSNGFT